jgi:hypothetical protein
MNLVLVVPSGSNEEAILQECATYRLIWSRLDGVEAEHVAFGLGDMRTKISPVCPQTGMLPKDLGVLRNLQAIVSHCKT